MFDITSSEISDALFSTNRNGILCLILPYCIVRDATAAGVSQEHLMGHETLKMREKKLVEMTVTHLFWNTSHNAGRYFAGLISAAHPFSPLWK
jgi:hypothetical protein